jgi:hypothetical protein
MNLYCKIRFIIAGLVLFISLISISSTFAEKSYNVAMITWRGETVAERGFIDENTMQIKTERDCKRLSQRFKAHLLI